MCFSLPPLTSLCTPHATLLSHSCFRLYLLGSVILPLVCTCPLLPTSSVPSALSQVTRFVCCVVLVSFPISHCPAPVVSRPSTCRNTSCPVLIPWFLCGTLTFSFSLAFRVALPCPLSPRASHASMSRDGRRSSCGCPSWLCNVCVCVRAYALSLAEQHRTSLMTRCSLCAIALTCFVPLSDLDLNSPANHLATTNIQRAVIGTSGLGQWP